MNGSRILATFLISLSLPAMADDAAAKSVLLVLSNHSELGDTGKKTGFYLSEAAHPYKVFEKAGLKVTLASPDGGIAPVDPKSFKLDDSANASFWKTFGNGNESSAAVATTLALGDVKSGQFDGIFFAGGHGAMWDFPTSADLRAVTADIWSRDGTVGAVCHGPAAFVNLKLPDGSLLVKGKKVAVFTNAEEKAVELTGVVPFSLQDSFEGMDATVVTGENFAENAVRDGKLVTGQNPASARKTAELFVAALKEAGE
ncbi:type 1 glutamine amidotransferase domain-containing protein [Luteolibacter marinus]|uniref:type 1 glutamine amidotransferase domain-containing protein n=1 Tax=Luteolibacter marinus TaxID=2776705 RepID=UPI001D028B46|nr:type 1 glutamine amidotransferase domain-containing protein [Luteolibacter marinus]